MLFGWRSGRGNEIPAPRSGSALSSPSRVVALTPDGPGWHDAVVRLEDALSAWSLPIPLARRWLQPARELFESGAPAELFIQVDPVDGLVDVELWDVAGARVYELQAHLGEPEVFRCSGADRRTRA